MGFEEQLRELLEKLNIAGQDKYKYSAKITTTAKGEAQIHASVKSDESGDHCKKILSDLVTDVLQICKDNNLSLPVPKV